MGQFTELPDGWTELKYDTGPKRGDGPYTEEFEATWASEDDEIVVLSRHSVDADGTVTYPITVEQRIEKDGLGAEIQTHARVAEDRQNAEKLAVKFMEEVNSGQHKLRVMGVEVPDEMDFIQFYTISDSEIPGEMTAEQLIDLIDSEQEPNDISDLPDEVSREVAEDQMIQVDVFPRHKSEVEGFDD